MIGLKLSRSLFTLGISPRRTLKAGIGCLITFPPLPSQLTPILLPGVPTTILELPVAFQLTEFDCHMVTLALIEISVGTGDFFFSSNLYLKQLIKMLTFFPHQFLAAVYIYCTSIGRCPDVSIENLTFCVFNPIPFFSHTSLEYFTNSPPIFCSQTGMIRSCLAYM